MKASLLLILLLVATSAFSQNWPLKSAVADAKAKRTVFTPLPAFSFRANKLLEGRGTYQELALDAGFKEQVMSRRPAALELIIPLNGGQSMTCELVKFDLGNAKITENNKDVIEGVKIPVLYRGIVTGEPQKHQVILTVNDTYISLVATFNDRAIQIMQADKNNPLTYRLYNSTTVQFPATAVNCGTTDKSTTSQTPDGIRLDGTYNRTGAVQDKCVNVMVDCFDSLYQQLGSNRQKTVDYVYELFALVATGYSIDSVNIQVMGINVWTGMDPYRQANSATALTDLGAYYKNNFWGNICVGLDFSTASKGRGGLAWRAKIKAMAPDACPAYNDADSSGAFSYCDLNFSGNIDGFPTGPNTTGEQLEVTMHEIGHQLGAHHTHWCGWQLSPAIVGAIDSCAAVENGPCMNVGITPPAAGGTIMSYCHLNAAGSLIAYSNGFGLLPGNAIRNFVNNSPCIQSCLACLIQNKSRTENNWTAQSKSPVLPVRSEGEPLSPVPLLLSGSKEIYWKRTGNNTIQLNR